MTVAPPPAVGMRALAYEVVQGTALAEESDGAVSTKAPTCVLCHGILGSRRNLVSFAKTLAVAFPAWQFLLFDLRCHGETASMEPGLSGSHTVENAALDVISTLNALKIYPFMLMGHSFGGKVVMSMMMQAGRVLPRPVQVWVLDTVPGDAWLRDGGDHPRDTIEFVSTLPMPLDSRKQLVESLTGAGFSVEGAQWMATNLKPVSSGSRQLDWTFDIYGIKELYSSYEACDLWPMLEQWKPKNCHVDFIRAEKSAFKWPEETLQRIDSTGCGVHFLERSSHWVHIDNPSGLIDILAPSFARLAP